MIHGRPERVAVLGAGAVGSYFGGMLARSGIKATLIGRAAHVSQMRRAGLTIERAAGSELIAVEATEDTGTLESADVILVCVKTFDTESAARLVAAYARRDALVVSMQNGVDNAERMRAAAGIDALAAVVYVAADLVAPGRVRHGGRGDLTIGDGLHLPGFGPRTGEIQRIARMFESAAVPCEISADIRVDLWRKLITNCAYNAISALTGAAYGTMTADNDVRGTMRSIVRECAAVARADGIAISESKMQEEVAALAGAMPDATSSMLQDRLRGRQTESDSLNGFIAQRAAAHGIEVPLCRALHGMIRVAACQPPPGQ